MVIAERNYLGGVLRAFLEGIKMRCSPWVIR